MRIGIDLVHIQRAEKALSEPDELKALFSEWEVSQLAAVESVASGIALKEAYCKAVGKKLPWHDISVGHFLSGAPYIDVGDDRIESVSVSHDGVYTVAVVFLT